METNDVDREDDAPAVTVTVVYHSVHGHTRVARRPDHRAAVRRADRLAHPALGQRSPVRNPRMTEHQARALSASLRETEDAPPALTGA